MNISEASNNNGSVRLNKAAIQQKIKTWTHEITRATAKINQYQDKIKVLKEKLENLKSQGGNCRVDQKTLRHISNYEQRLNRTEMKLQKCMTLMTGGGDGSPTPIKSSVSFRHHPMKFFESSLHLDIEPTSGESFEFHEIFNAKKEFFQKIMQEIPTDDIAKIANQSKHLPLMKEAIKELRANYENWDGLENKTIMDTIKNQHSNIIYLSAIFHELETTNVNNLMQVTFFNKNIEQLLRPYVEGKKIIETSDRDLIIASLQQEINTIIEELPTPLSREQLIKKRVADRVSKSAIIAEAQLFSAERAAKIEALSVKKLTEQGTSINKVFHVKEAYFKTNHDGDKAGAIMEELIWDLSVLLGLEEQFTATKISSLHTTASKGITATVWNDKGELEKCKGLSKASVGGIQAEQAAGMTLQRYLNEEDNLQNDQKEISKKNVISATIAQYTFGMFDAHINNILVEKNGALKYFDNTRSMPASNSVIQSGTSLVPVFRSGLLALDFSYEPLTEAERNDMKMEIMKIQSHIAAVENFLNDPREEKKLASLPPGWWNTEQSLTALKERIDSLSAAINNPKALCLRDILFAANPDVKFFAALEMIKFKIDYPNVSDLEWEKFALLMIGTSTVNDLIGKLSLKDLDVAEVQRMCQDPSVDFRDIVMKSMESMKKNGNIGVGQKNLQRSQAKKILSQYKSQAVIDLKDIRRTECCITAYTIALELMHSNRIPIWSESDAHDSLEGEEIYNNIVVKEPGLALSIVYKEITGDLKKIPLDFHSKVGVISVKNPGTIVRNINQEEAENRLDQQPIGTYLFRPCSSGQSLIVSFVDEEGGVNHASFLMKDNTLADADDEFNSLEEILLKYADIFVSAAPLLLADLHP